MKTSTQVLDLTLDSVRLNSYNERERDESSLFELAGSIVEHGVLEPIIVRPLPDGSYEVVAGERRVRASRLAEKATVPAIVHRLDDKAAVELCIIENLQRESIDPVSEARMFRKLLDFGDPMPSVTKRIGRSEGYVRDRLALLDLPEDVQGKVRRGEMSMSQAKPLTQLAETPETLSQMAEEILREKASGRKVQEATTAPTMQFALTYGQMSKQLNRLADQISRTMGGLFRTRAATLEVEPATEVWVKFRHAEHPQRVRVLVLRITENGPVWTVHTVAGAKFAWASVERLANPSEAKR